MIFRKPFSQYSFIQRFPGFTKNFYLPAKMRWLHDTRKSRQFESIYIRLANKYIYCFYVVLLTDSTAYVVFYMFLIRHELTERV